MKLTLIFFFLFSLSSAWSFGSDHHTLNLINSDTTKSNKVTISGTVKEARTGANLPNTLVIQKGVGGKFLNLDGSFKITIRRTDTLLISTTGYNIHKFCFKDSSGTKFHLNLEMSLLKRDLATHVVMPKRKLSEIHKDLEEVRLELPHQPDFTESISSPITAIYETFSKIAKSKRKVIEMEHEDMKNDLLKELFRVYIDGDIMNLSPDEFERFIYFSNVSDSFLRTATEYQLIVFFQSRFKEYLALKR